MKTVSIFIDKTEYEINPGLLKGEALLALADVSGTQQLLLERKDDIDIPVLSDDYLIIDGQEEFSIGDGQPPIEENPCLRKPIRFFFNGEKVSGNDALAKPKLMGADLLAYDPDGQAGDGLFADLEGADEPVLADQRIIVQDKDRFITTPCGNVGYELPSSGPLAQHFEEVCGYCPDATLSPQEKCRYLIIPGHQLPDHWVQNRTDLMVVIPDGYPLAGLDMFYVSPEINLRSGRVPGGSGHRELFLNRQWQRFSWHYQKPWNPNRDSLLSHLRFCMVRLAKPE